MTRYWFRPKRYGYGATPVTWEGWAVSLLPAVVLLASIVAVEVFAGPTNFAAWAVWFVFMVVVVLWWFVRFSRKHTDGEWRWRWGERVIDQ